MARKRRWLRNGRAYTLLAEEFPLENVVYNTPLENGGIYQTWKYN